MEAGRAEAGRAAYRTGDFGTAEREFTGALLEGRGRAGGGGAEAGRAGLLLNRSAARAGRGDWGGSLRDAAAAARRAPQDPRAWFRAGQALLALRDSGSAGNAFRFGLGVAPGSLQLAEGLELAGATQRAEFRKRRAAAVQEARDRATRERLGRLGLEEHEVEIEREREAQRRREAARWLHEERCERDRILRDTGWKKTRQECAADEQGAPGGGGGGGFTSFYGVLDVGSNVKPEELRKAYLKRLPFVHPDKGGDEADFILLQRAYDELSDPDSRARHDAALAAHLRKD